LPICRQIWKNQERKIIKFVEKKLQKKEEDLLETNEIKLF
jgi:hypothetical protein